MIKTIKKVAVIIMTVVIMISTVTIADQASSTTVQAASGYSGKIYKHWCKLRTAKSKRSKTIKKLSVGTKVTVLSTSGSWRKIKVGNKTGYALKKYVYISTNAPKLTGSTYNKGRTVASFAQRFVGNPYVWGGTTPSGFDCSGLVQYVYGQIGVNISRTTYTQVNEGRYVSRDELLAGDLVFFGDSSSPHHVGMYIGDGMMIHAPQTGDVVKIASLSARSDYATARRIVE